MKPRPSFEAEPLTETRVVGGHYRAGKLDPAYAAYLVLGVCLAVMAVAHGLGAMVGPWRALLGVFLLAPCVPAVIMVIWYTLRYAAHWPLPALALFGAATPFAAAALDARGGADLLPWLAGALAALYVLAPLGWFLAGRKRHLTARFTLRALSPYSRQVVSWLLILLGGAGCLLWPFVWSTFYSETGMPGWTGGPQTLIFLGYAPFVALLAVGLATWPERLRKRGP